MQGYMLTVSLGRHAVISESIYVTRTSCSSAVWLRACVSKSSYRRYYIRLVYGGSPYNTVVVIPYDLLQFRSMKLYHLLC